MRAVFSLNSLALNHLFPSGNQPPKHLAYVEWFTPFQSQPERNSQLYKVSRALRPDGQTRVASIIPVGNITQSIHLFPLVGNAIQREWTSATVLEECHSFFVNIFTDPRTYLLFSQC